jgi:hypothetical protein
MTGAECAENPPSNSKIAGSAAREQPLKCIAANFVFGGNSNAIA